MTKRDLIIIFVKNPVAGQVKTRLAKSIGNERALKVYLDLLEHTRQTTYALPCSKAVFYSQEVVDLDVFEPSQFLKYEQEGGDLGERMLNAFQLAFHREYNKVVLIGSDCYELNAGHLREAFDALENNEVVLGPAKDGGYYLIGMQQMHQKLFVDKPWSTSDLLLDTILELKKEGASYRMLDTLSDIDTEEDLKRFQTLTGHEDERDHTNH